MSLAGIMKCNFDSGTYSGEEEEAAAVEVSRQLNDVAIIQDVTGQNMERNQDVYQGLQSMEKNPKVYISFPLLERIA